MIPIDSWLGSSSIGILPCASVQAPRLEIVGEISCVLHMSSIMSSAPVKRDSFFFSFFFHSNVGYFNVPLDY